MKVEELCSELLGKKNKSKEDFADFDAKTEQQEFKDKHYWEMFFYFFYTMLLYNFYLDFELMRIKYHELQDENFDVADGQFYSVQLAQCFTNIIVLALIFWALYKMREMIMQNREK